MFQRMRKIKNRRKIRERLKIREEKKKMKISTIYELRKNDSSSSSSSSQDSKECNLKSQSKFT